MAHPLLISLANIDMHIHSKTSLHTYLLLALLPIAKFTHKVTRIRGLLQDQLVHQALSAIVLLPLKTAASVGIMMNDPRGNLHYCFMPLAAWIADTPEESLLAGTSIKVSPVTMATANEFGDAHRHPPRTAANMLAAIRTACSQCSPVDYTSFLKAVKWLQLNSIVEPFWKLWLLSDPSKFITPEVLHHFHRMFWDHDVKWCVAATGAVELDFCFSVIQTLVGYRAFEEGISKLKQVTGRDHHAVQRYIIAAVAGSVPCKFLTAIHALLDFHYLAQVPSFTTQSIHRVASALQEFHNHKESISIVLSIHQSGAVMQWSADITKHAHVDEIKVLAWACNNQSYESQIVCQIQMNEGGNGEDSSESDEDEEHEVDMEKTHLSGYSTLTCRPPDYLTISAALLGAESSVQKPYHMFAMSTTGFHLATKPSLQLTVDEAASTYQLPDLKSAMAAFFTSGDSCFPGQEHKLQIWQKVRVQQLSYHSKTLLLPQTLRAILPSTTNCYGHYNSAIVSLDSQSDWPKSGLAGHLVSQLQMIFHVSCLNSFLTYVQHFNIVPQPSPVTGMHMLNSLVAHSTPFSLLWLVSIPVALRRKTDWFHEAMDPMVDNDTCETHWELSEGNSSRKLLDSLFPDEVVFGLISTGKLFKHQLNYFSMEQVFKNLVNKGLYNEGE
ncbi:hypothetical protein EDD15DRAFT_2373881 [Pisolithus albus]|nr:hypothetical protein EDD15DRAFT_2373881 [Pisolithus albus]